MPSQSIDDPSLKVRVITAHSGLDAFRDSIRSLWSEFRSARHLAWRFFLRDTRADHRQSLLGYVWLVFPAVANTLTWVFLNSQNVVHIDSGTVPYPIFVLSGTIIWTAFNGSLMALLGVVGAGRGLLSKVDFPHEALVYSAVLKSSTDAFLASILLIPALFVFGAVWHLAMLLFPVALFASLLLGCTLGLIAVPLAALYSDVGRIVQLILRFGFFFTPVIFQLPASGLGRRIMLLNPATPIIASGRSWLTGSSEAMPAAFVATVVACLILFSIAMVFYKVSLPHVIERLSA